MIYALILHLDAPMQAWGIDSKFRHRGAGAAPSKSAVCGMVCAAFGAAKGSDLEAEILAQFRQIRMDCFCLKTDGILVDYHTVQNFRRASGKIDTSGTVLSHRHYWQSARYNVLLKSNDKEYLTRIGIAIQSPVWGIWFGRKCCLPAAPIIQEPVMDYASARELAAKGSYESFSEVDDFESGTDTWFDQPIGLGIPHSSGREGRTYVPRRVNHYIPHDSDDQTEYFRF